MAVRARSLQALFVPDARTWAMAGIDVMDAEFTPSAALHDAEALVVAEELPESFRTSLAESVLRFPDPGRAFVRDGAPLGTGEKTREWLDGSVETHDDGEQRGGHEEQAGHQGHDEHGEHENHEDMMSVEGEPSRDGLVMEEASVTLGPIQPRFPSGLLIDLSLDGDVVSELAVRCIEAPTGAPTLVPKSAAWQRARSAGHKGSHESPTHTSQEEASFLQAVEIERALSHLMWLSDFAGLLGWGDLERDARSVARPLIGGEPSSEAASAGLDKIEKQVDGRRMMKAARGLGRIDEPECRSHGVRGPIARACGLADDARIGDPAYEYLGFEPVVYEDGDVAARAKQRLAEARSSLRLADKAREIGELPVGGGMVEGPRGPLSSADSHTGQWSALAAAVTRGQELARALRIVHSLDLDPWSLAR